MRTKIGLPFVCTKYMKLVLEGILARVQRDSKIVLCHLDWMGNHPHILAVARDSLQCVRFYAEVQKQATDAVKRFLGVKHLNLWQKNGTSVVLYGDLAGVMERIAYLYANPARAHLVDSIGRYPGLSSWEAFQQTPHSLSGTYKKLCPWVRAPSISTPSSRSVTPAQDLFITEKLRQRTNKEHELVLQPNAWMRAFGVQEEEVEGINKGVLARLQEMEEAARQERIRRGFRVMGVSKLQAEPLSLEYCSKNDSRRIFVYALDPELRKELIESYRLFCERCEECYERWKVGDYTVEWPPGAFLPAMPPRANWFAE